MTDHSPHSPKNQPEPGHTTSQGSLTLDLFGTLVTFQVRSAETDGAYAILEMAVPAGRTTPQMRVHAATKTFQILDGEFEFHAERDGHTGVFRAAAGDIVHIPPNVPHAFRNVSKSPSSFQVILAPGSMEGYFLELGTPTTNDRPSTRPGDPPDMKRLVDVGRKYGIEFIDLE